MMRQLLMISSLFLFSQGLFAQAACNNGQDLQQVYKGNTAFAEALEACSSIGGLDTSCFSERCSGLTDACLGCFANASKCTADNCAWTCMTNGARSTECGDCSHQYCGGNLQNCTGLPPEYWPEFQH